MNRLIVKANYASLKIPSLEFEIPPDTQKGSINTLEGFIEMSISELEQDQPTRRVRKDTVLRERQRDSDRERERLLLLKSCALDCIMEN